MINKFCYQISLIAAIAATTSACSPVNSVSVFDQKQVEALIHENTTSKPAKEMVKLNLQNPTDWEKIDISTNQRGTPAILIPLNETTDNWSQKISTSNYAFLSIKSPMASRIVMREIDNAKQNCKHADAKILSETRLQIIYRLQSAGCPDQKDQMQIAKAFNGSDAVYIVRYAALTPAVSAKQIDKMARVIETAQLVKSPVQQ
jgi:hypothetical protein